MAGRKGAFGACGRLSPNMYLTDTVVPRNRLPEVLASVYAIGQKHGIRMANVFHAGDGNLHPILLYDEKNEEETERMLAACAEITEACVAVGWMPEWRTRHRTRQARPHGPAVLGTRSGGHAEGEARIRSGGTVQPREGASAACRLRRSRALEPETAARRRVGLVIYHWSLVIYRLSFSRLIDSP